MRRKDLGRWVATLAVTGSYLAAFACGSSSSQSTAGGGLGDTAGLSGQSGAGNASGGRLGSGGVGETGSSGAAGTDIGSGGTAVGGVAGANAGSGGSGVNGTAGANAGSGGASAGAAGSVGAGGEAGGGACSASAISSHVALATLVFVFDQSTSMAQPFGTPDGGSSGPKWQVSEDAISAVLAANGAELNAGAIFFPTVATGNTCSLVDLIGTSPQISIEPGATFVTDLQAHFSAPGWTTILGTPLKTALGNADLALPDASPGARAVVVVTDGAPTCDTAQADIVAPVQAMFSRGIKSYAIGLPGSAAASTLLGAIAVAGGTTSALSPGDSATLQASVTQIVSDTVDPCLITITSPLTNASLLYLMATDAAHPQGYELPRTADENADGWSLSADGATATLLGSVCATDKSGGYTSLQFVSGCPALP